MRSCGFSFLAYVRVQMYNFCPTHLAPRVSPADPSWQYTDSETGMPPDTNKHSGLRVDWQTQPPWYRPHLKDSVPNFLDWPLGGTTDVEERAGNVGVLVRRWP